MPKRTIGRAGSKKRSFGLDRKGESSAGATGKDKKKSVDASRANTSR